MSNDTDNGFANPCEAVILGAEERHGAAWPERQRGSGSPSAPIAGVADVKAAHALILEHEELERWLGKLRRADYVRGIVISGERRDEEPLPKLINVREAVMTAILGRCAALRAAIAAFGIEVAP